MKEQFELEAMTRAKIGIEIKCARKYRHLSQERFAELLGTKQESVARWENGKSFPTVKTLKRIADVLGASLTIGFAGIRTTTYYP